VLVEGLPLCGASWTIVIVLSKGGDGMVNSWLMSVALYKRCAQRGAVTAAVTPVPQMLSRLNLS
jgi:hypothetical protein